MANDSEDMTIQILRQIQSTLSEVQNKLAEHDKRFENMDQRFEHIDQHFDRVDGRFEFADGRLEAVRQHFDGRFDRVQDVIDHRFDAFERRFGDLAENAAKGLGLASIANTRHDTVEKQLIGVETELDDIRARLNRLEEKV